MSSHRCTGSCEGQPFVAGPSWSEVIAEACSRLPDLGRSCSSTSCHWPWPVTPRCRTPPTANVAGRGTRPSSTRVWLRRLPLRSLGLGAHRLPLRSLGLGAHRLPATLALGLLFA